MKEDLLKIINTYEVMPQLKYFQSEVFELNEAIIEYETTKRLLQLDAMQERFEMYAFKRHIAEEIADVTVMLKQFQHYYGISDKEIEEVMKFKVERTIKRMENEYYEK